MVFLNYAKAVRHDHNFTVLTVLQNPFFSLVGGGGLSVSYGVPQQVASPQQIVDALRSPCMLRSRSRRHSIPQPLDSSRDGRGLIARATACLPLPRPWVTILGLPRSWCGAKVARAWVLACGAAGIC